MRIFKCLSASRTALELEWKWSWACILWEPPKESILAEKSIFPKDWYAMKPLACRFKINFIPSKIAALF